MKLLNGIGLGTFPFASPFTPVSEQEAKKIIAKYLDSGGIYFDVAPTYSFGKVEELLGESLKSVDRDRFFINSFCGYVFDKNADNFVKSGRYQDVIDDCNASLKRLKVTYLDLYTNHIPDPDTDYSETISAMEELRKQGKILQIGVSNVDLDQLMKYNSSGSISYVQMRFSLLNQYFTPEFIQYCNDQDIGIIAYQVIERGLLTNKITQDFSLRDGDLRHSKPEFNKEFINLISDWVREELLPIANSLRIPVATLVIWWALQQPAISLCQSGATKISHVDEIIAATTIYPSEHTVNRINIAYKNLENRVKNKKRQGVREFMGLANNMYQNLSATGQNKSQNKS